MTLTVENGLASRLGVGVQGSHVIHCMHTHAHTSLMMSGDAVGMR